MAHPIAFEYVPEKPKSGDPNVYSAWGCPLFGI